MDNESVATIFYKIKLIDSARVMPCSFASLPDSLTEGIHKIICKVCDCFLEYESAKDNLIKYKCLSCNADYSKKIDEELKRDSTTHISFLIMISINLLYC